MSLISSVLSKASTSNWIKSGISVAAGKSVIIVSNFFIFYLLVRVCSENQFGTWILFTSIYGIFEVANSSFVNNAIIKYYNDFKSEDRGLFVFNALLFTIILTIVISIILAISLYFIDHIYHSETLNTLLKYAILLLATSSLINFGNCIEQANMKFKGQLIVSLIKSSIFVSYLLLIYFLKIGFTLNDFLLVQVGSNLIAIIAVYFITAKYLSFTFGVNRNIIIKITHYGFFTFGIEVIGNISGNIGQLIAGALLSPISVGLLNVATRVLNLIEVPLQSIAQILLPKGVVALNQEGMAGVKTLYEKSAAVITAFMFPILILFFVFSDQIIIFIAGEKFIEASILLKIILVYSLFKPFGRNAGVMLNAIGKTKINLYMVLIPTAINLLLNYWMIKSLGVIGSPIATLIATIVGFIFNQYVLYKIANVSFPSIIKLIKSYYISVFNLARNGLTKREAINRL